MAEPITLRPPLDEKTVRSLHAGQRVLIGGAVLTGRDAAHKRLCELLQAGKELPIKLDGEIIQSGITLLEECRLHYDFLIIASTQEQYRADYIKSQYDFMRHVDRTFFSCEMGLKKPDAEYFQHVEASLSSTSITLFDDSNVNVHAAIACGWKGYHYTGESSLKEFLT